MSQIHILPENLANQIAAGEVVERPASVVKELIENAIDAGASNISIQVEGGGIRLVRVIDDGSGMDQDDILLCLERHATSKLKKQDELSSINTLGFRGEAIPSISSVSKMAITSMLMGDSLGNRVDIHYGSIKKVHEMGCSHGTIMEVRDLFGNVPARRKFLKSTQTEISHISEIVRAYSLYNNKAGFSFQVNGKCVLDVPAKTDSREKRFRKILGVSSELVTIVDPHPDENDTLAVSGYLIPPDAAQGKAAKLWLFVNGRSVKDRMLNHAVAHGLQGFLMKGHRAAGVIYLSISPSHVDVNVHPTKQEVRFQRASLVHGRLAETVRKGMEGFQNKVKFAVFGSEDKKVPVAHKHEEPVTKTCQAPVFKPFPETVSMEPRALYTENSESSKTIEPNFSQQKVVNSTAPLAREMALAREKISSPTEIPGPLPPENTTLTIKYIGQLFESYILCEVDGALVAIDQHAAQERLLYEELLEHYKKQDMPSQVLLFPEMLELTASQIQVVEQNSHDIQQFGLDIQGFGGESYVVKSVPASLAHIPALEILFNILESFSESETGTAGRCIENVVAGMACKAAIKAGHTLQREEVMHLLARMQKAGIFSHCPHGRPVVKRFSSNDVKRWFYRT